MDHHSLNAIPKEAHEGLKMRDKMYYLLESQEDGIRTPNAMELLRKATGC